MTTDELTRHETQFALDGALAPHADALQSLAARCDKMCLTAGIQLGDAVPGLYDLSNRFTSLSEMLLNEGGAKPAESLEAVADDIMSIGTALTSEKESVAVVITLNAVLSRRLGDLADNVRFLSSVVSNVKIEIATINEGELRLEGFADNLKQLASKSEVTVKAFQETHQTLIKQLQLTATAQSAFVTLHGKKFAVASQEIRASLGTVSERRKVVAGIAGEIGALTQKIGAQIAQCVMTLQIGDSTRQRLEHAGEGVSTALDIIMRREPEGVFDGEPLYDDPLQRERIAARICMLEVIQTIEATAEFAKDIGTIAYLINQIGGAGGALGEKSRALVASPGDTSRSFLADLESKLAFAGELIGECGSSRKLVDDTAERVIASVLDLQALAKDVAAMATDMTIIGTNAVVTSYRLGTKGIPLSVIAQHLRNHAVRVTDAVKLVIPALDKVLDAAQQFTSAREGQDAGSMEGLAARITEALAAFRAGDGAVADVHDRLDAESMTIAGVLSQASNALDDIDALEAELRGVAEAVEDLASATDVQGEDESFPAALSRLLRDRYTMGSERVIHDEFLGHEAPVAPPTAASEDDASLWL